MCSQESKCVGGGANVTKIGLGTVQLGLPYGNNSHVSVMSESAAHAILQLAIESGRQFFDTAQSYGESEARIGSFNLFQRCPSAEVSTKIPTVDRGLWQDSNRYLAFLKESVHQSCNRLRTRKLGLLQFHQCDLEFLSAPSVRTAMSCLMDMGFCEAIGVSVYDPEQALMAMDIPAVSALQVPASIVDTRFFRKDLLAFYKHRKMRILTRSNFMQGVLLDTAPLPVVPMKNVLANLRKQFLDSLNGAPPLDVCLNFILVDAAAHIDVAIIGVESVESLRANLASANRAVNSSFDIDQGKLETVRQYAEEMNLLNPALWLVAK
jgi:aryl-alcohol dehydrogenase-like predicted oxidoreductase